MPAASVAITLTTLVLLIVSTVIVLTRLDGWSTSRLAPEPSCARAGLVATVLAGRGHRGVGGDKPEPPQLIPAVEPNQRRC
jgi:hypothetical protein